MQLGKAMRVVCEKCGTVCTLQIPSKQYACHYCHFVLGDFDAMVKPTERTRRASGLGEPK